MLSLREKQYVSRGQNSKKIKNHSNNPNNQQHNNEKENKQFEIPLTPTDNKIAEISKTENFKYTDFMNKILVRKFSKLGAFKNFDALINSANRLYEIKDQISDYIFILEKDSRLKEIILKKRTQNANIPKEIFFTEANIISEINNEIENKVGKYKQILNESDFKIFIETCEESTGSNSFKLFMTKEFPFMYAKRLINLLYEEKNFFKFIPYVEYVETLKHLSKSKKCCSVFINIPNMEKREVNVFNFVNNKMRESSTIQFIGRSFDIENESEFFKNLKDNMIIIEENKYVKIDLHYASFEIIFDFKEEVVLRVLIKINPRLKFVEDRYLEILAKEYGKLLIHNINETLKLDDDKYVSKFWIDKSKSNNLDDEKYSALFYDFYHRIMEEFLGNEHIPKNEKNYN